MTQYDKICRLVKFTAARINKRYTYNINIPLIDRLQIIAGDSGIELERKNKDRSAENLIWEYQNFYGGLTRKY